MMLPQEEVINLLESSIASLSEYLQSKLDRLIEENKEDVKTKETIEIIKVFITNYNKTVIGYVEDIHSAYNKERIQNIELKGKIQGLLDNLKEEQSKRRDEQCSKQKD